MNMELGVRVEKVGRCVVVRMERGENRQNLEFIEAMNQALDKVERYTQGMHSGGVANKHEARHVELVLYVQLEVVDSLSRA